MTINDKMFSKVIKYACVYKHGLDSQVINLYTNNSKIAFSFLKAVLIKSLSFKYFHCGSIKPIESLIDSNRNLKLHFLFCMPFCFSLRWRSKNSGESMGRKIQAHTQLRFSDKFSIILEAKHCILQSCHTA